MCHDVEESEQCYTFNELVGTHVLEGCLDVLVHHLDVGLEHGQGLARDAWGRGGGGVHACVSGVCADAVPCLAGGCAGARPLCECVCARAPEAW